MSDFPLIYANIILGVTSRNPGIFQVTFGTSGFGTLGEPTSSPRTSLGLALPADTARALGESLAAATAPKEEPKPQSDDADRYNTLRNNALRLSIVMLGLKEFIGDMVGDVRDTPGIIDRLTNHAKSAVRSVKGIETTGLDIVDEAEILGAAITELEEWLDAAVTAGMQDGDR